MRKTFYFVLAVFFILPPILAVGAQESLQKILTTGIKIENAGNYAQALEFYQKASQAQPSPQIYSRLIGLLGKLRRYEDAEAALNKAIKLFPSDAGLLNLQGLVCLRQKNVEGARKAWTKVLEIEPDNSFARKKLANIAARIKPLQKPVEAKEKQKAKTSGPLSLEEQKKLVKSNLQTIADLEADDAKTMLNLYRDIIDRCPDTAYAPEACWRTANINLLSFNPPDYAAAAQVLEHMLKFYPEEMIPSYTVRARLVNCYEQTKNYQKAAVHIKNIISGSPKMPARDKINFLFRYAESLNGAGQKEGARALYEQVINDGEPHSSAVRLARKRLEQ